MAFDPRWIVGKTVASVEMRPFRAREGSREVTHAPRIFFTDGSHIAFTGQETDFGAYGVGVGYYKPSPQDLAVIENVAAGASTRRMPEHNDGHQPARPHAGPELG